MSKKTFRSVAAVVALASAAVLVPAPAQATEANDRLVKGWYRDFLQRGSIDAAGDYGREHWVQRLDAADGRPDVEAARREVLTDIVRSPEYVQRHVTDSYRAILGRRPDAGASYWIEGATKHGMALEWVDQNLLASRELHERWASRSNRDDLYVQQLYVHVLGRYAWETTPGERAYWVGRVRAVGRLAAVRELWYADEAVRHRLASHYRSLLGRESVDRYGLHHWYPQVVQSDLRARVALASTNEYALGAFVYQDPQLEEVTLTYLGQADPALPDFGAFLLVSGDVRTRVVASPGVDLSTEALLSWVRFVSQAPDRTSAVVRILDREVELTVDVPEPLEE